MEAARASGWVVWGLTGAIVAFAAVACWVLVRFGGPVVMEYLVAVLAALAVGFAAVSWRAAGHRGRTDPP